MYSIYNDDNDLFFVCSMIDYTARKTKNKRIDIINIIGKDTVLNLYKYADAYHCDSPDKVCGELIDEYKIKLGSFDNISNVNRRVPTYWEMGKIYMRLILNTLSDEDSDKSIMDKYQIKVVDKLYEVYNSFITEYIDDYNDPTYFNNPEYHYRCYVSGEMLD